MVLDDNTMRKLVQEEKLIENFIEKNLQSASYDVTIAKNAFVFPNITKPIELNDAESIASLLNPVDISSGYFLKPNEFILCTLNEKFNVPSNLCAHIKPRTSFIKLGLITTSQFMNPTYSGILNIGILNVSNSIYVLRPNISIAQFLFEELTGEPSEHKLYKNKANAKFQHEDGTVDSRIYTDEIVSEFKKVFYGDIQNE